MNAALTDSGIYTCRATNNIGEPAQNTKDEQKIELTVYGSPVILNQKVEECSVGGKVLIEWKPSSQTVGVVHRISATREGNTVADYTRTITAQIHESTTIEKLSADTNYAIKITVCPDECIISLYAQTVIQTRMGLPNPVTDARVIKISESECNLTWAWLESKLKTDATFEIIENATLVYLSSNVHQHTFTEKHLYEGKSLDSFRVRIETKPNRNYTFYINAKTCIGRSNRITAIGECLTNVAAPENVPVPTAVWSEVRKATQLIDITIPDETRGPISCIFIIVKSGGRILDEITTEKLTRLSENALVGKSEENEYLAFAVQRSKIKGTKMQISLGDDTNSFCNLSTSMSTNLTRVKRAVTGYISGRNLPLEIGSTYTYYAVTSTYSVTSDKVFLQRSSSAVFILKKTKDSEGYLNVHYKYENVDSILTNNAYEEISV
uniref:uncharacterized protein LOC120336064 n=1 Tax=Styela clava TaxID=7725 RepID=UPI0019394DE9|nr:uncharacterized protein LOC120336064 [Styela clava]